MLRAVSIIYCLLRLSSGKISWVPRTGWSLEYINPLDIIQLREVIAAGGKISPLQRHCDRIKAGKTILAYGDNQAAILHQSQQQPYRHISREMAAVIRSDHRQHVEYHQYW